MSERNSRICPHVIPPISNRIPDYPMCGKVGLSIVAVGEFATGYARIAGCPLKSMTDEFCQVTNERIFGQLNQQPPQSNS